MYARTTIDMTLRVDKEEEDRRRKEKKKERRRRHGKGG